MIQTSNVKIVICSIFGYFPLKLILTFKNLQVLLTVNELAENHFEIYWSKQKIVIIFFQKKRD